MDLKLGKILCYTSECHRFGYYMKHRSNPGPVNAEYRVPPDVLGRMSERGWVGKIDEDMGPWVLEAYGITKEGLAALKVKS